MLSTRKSHLKRLWKASAAGKEESAAGEDLFEAMKSLLKPLDSKELKACAIARDTSTTTTSTSEDCWLLASERVNVGHVSAAPELLCCKVFRWPDLPLQDTLLRRLPHCKGNDVPGRTCCNPRHYGRVISFDLKSYGNVEQPSTKGRRSTPATEGSVSVDSAYSEGSVSTLSTSSSPLISARSRSSAPKSLVQVSESGLDESSDYSVSESVASLDSESARPVVSCDSESWLMLAYWEGNARVGRRKSFADRAVHVHYDGSAVLPDSFCIGSMRSKHRTAAAEKKRLQIGNGFQMWRGADFKVYFYNASEQSMYIQSPTLACYELDDSSDLVKAIPAGCVAEIFDWERAVALEEALRSRQQLRHPFDAAAVRISMVSGWGAGHRRQSVMQCPCWVEAFFGGSQRD